MRKSLIPVLVVMLTLLLAGTGYASPGQFVADAPTETPAGDSFRPVYLQQLSGMREKLQELKEAEALEHQVVRGETLGAIAKQYGTSVEYLMGINGLRNPNLIREGQVLTLLVESPSSDVALVTHTLRAGDTVWVLAKRYNVSVEAIMVANKIADPRRLSTGQQLVIPGAYTTTAVPQQTEPQRVVASRSAPRSDTGFIWPCPGYISSGYGPRWGSFHYGLDIAAVTGTPIVAIASGVVTSAGWRGNYGYMVRIDHKNGWESVYAHASKVFVKVGQEVSSGQRIANVGQTGNATGPHVHLETIFQGKHQNPIRHLPAR